jgi:membrane protease YdiL (CAAX protease family)
MTPRSYFIKEGRLRPTWRVVCYTLAVLLGSIVMQIMIAIFLLLPAMFLLGATDESAVMELAFSLPVLLIVSVANVALILPLTYLFRRFLDGGTLVDLGFHRKAGWPKGIVGGLLLGTVLIALIFLLEWGAGWLEVQGFIWEVQSPPLVLMNLTGYFIMMTLVAFHEELSFRGYILQNLDVEWGPIVGVIASSVLFGIFHALNPNFSWLALFNIFVAGVLLAACYFVTGELWLPMAFHFSWNFLQGPILSFPVSGLVTSGLVLTEIGGDPSLTGGTFGPEGGLISTVVMSLGLLILLLWRRWQKPRSTDWKESE